MKAVGTVVNSGADDVLSAVMGDARRHWDIGGESVNKESDTQFTVKYAGGY